MLKVTTNRKARRQNPGGRLPPASPPASWVILVTAHLWSLCFLLCKMGVVKMVNGRSGGLARPAPKHRLHRDGLNPRNSPRPGQVSTFISHVAISQMR